MSYEPFSPEYGSNQTATLVAATQQTFTISKNSPNVRIYNSSTGKLYARTFSFDIAPATVAAATDYVVAAGETRTISKYATHDRISFISPAGTNVEFMTGAGV